MKNERGKKYLDEGRTLLEITSTSNTQYFYAFTLKCINPEVEMTDSNNNKITSIKNGTVNFEVEIGKIPYDDVYFVIYEQSGNTKKLYKIAKATVKDGLAEGVLSDIEMKSGSNYYAKAFMWDETRLVGYSITI